MVLQIKEICKNCKQRKDCESFNAVKKYFDKLKKCYSKYPEKPEVTMSFDSKHIMIPGLIGSDADISPFWIQIQLDNGYFMNYIPLPDAKPNDPADCIYIQ